MFCTDGEHSEGQSTQWFCSRTCLSFFWELCYRGAWSMHSPTLLLRAQWDVGWGDGQPLLDGWRHRLSPGGMANVTSYTLVYQRGTSVLELRKYFTVSPCWLLSKDLFWNMLFSLSTIMTWMRLVHINLGPHGIFSGCCLSSVDFVLHSRKLSPMYRLAHYCDNRKLWLGLQWFDVIWCWEVVCCCLFHSCWSASRSISMTG